MKSIAIDFQRTGINKIDVNEAISQWSHLWSIAEWRSDNNWRVIKNIRWDSEITGAKLTISEAQARELIERLDLKPINVFLKSAFTWRREQDWVYLRQKRKDRIGS